jgi:hypothetical protein
MASWGPARGRDEAFRGGACFGGVRRLVAAVVVLAGLSCAGPAFAEPVAIPWLRLLPYPGPSLAQGPFVLGGQIVWAQQRCLGGCSRGVFSPFGTESLYLIKSVGDDGARVIARLRLSRYFSGGPSFADETVSFLVSERVLVTVRVKRTGDEGGEFSGVVVRAGAPATGRPLLVDCSSEEFSGQAPVALDGNRVAYDSDPCDDRPRLVLRDLGTGETVALPEPAGGRLLSLRGRFVAWIAGLGADARLVVYDLMMGTTAYSAPATGVQALDLDADGTVAAVSGEPRRPCATGRLLRYSLAAPEPADLGPACATGVVIDGGRIVHLGWDGPTRTLRLSGPDRGGQDLVRFGRVRPGSFDADGERIVWTARDCGGDKGIFRATLAEAPLSAGSVNCRARFEAGVVPVRRRIAIVRLRCPRGCAGELSLRHMGGRWFSILTGEPKAVRVRLRRDLWDRLKRLGSLPALAKVVTLNRAGDRQARSRAVTLMAR